jgi:integrase
MAKTTHYCVREAKQLPENQFDHDDNGVWVHKTGTWKDWHFADTGERVFPIDQPPPAEFVPPRGGDQ